MGGPTAFQTDAFQSDAFQMEVGVITPQPLPYPFPFDRTPHGVPIASAVFSRRGSGGVFRFPRGSNVGRITDPRKASGGSKRTFKRRGRGEDQGETDPTRD